MVYILPNFLSLSNVGLNSKTNKRETQVFPPNSKHIQQLPHLVDIEIAALLIIYSLVETSFSVDLSSLYSYHGCHGLCLIEGIQFLSYSMSVLLHFTYKRLFVSYYTHKKDFRLKVYITASEKESG